MNFFAEQIPPELQEALKVVVAGWSLNLTAERVEVLVPWLCFTDEVEDFDFLVESKIIFMLINFYAKFL
jgi:hypothetical protein